LRLATAISLVRMRVWSMGGVPSHSTSRMVVGGRRITARIRSLLLHIYSITDAQIKSLVLLKINTVIRPWKRGYRIRGLLERLTCTEGEGRVVIQVLESLHANSSRVWASKISANFSATFAIERRKIPSGERPPSSSADKGQAESRNQFRFMPRASSSAIWADDLNATTKMG
jgi:hypothetical protein